MKVKTDYDGCGYITAGKEYEVVDVDRDHDDLVSFVNDRGRSIWTRVGAPSAHLDGKGQFEFVKESPELDWTPWHGGSECPVPDGHDVSVKFNSGAIHRDIYP